MQRYCTLCAKIYMLVTRVQNCYEVFYCPPWGSPDIKQTLKKKGQRPNYLCWWLKLEIHPKKSHEYWISLENTQTNMKVGGRSKIFQVCIVYFIKVMFTIRLSYLQNKKGNKPEAQRNRPWIPCHLQTQLILQRGLKTYILPPWLIRMSSRPPIHNALLMLWRCNN